MARMNPAISPANARMITRRRRNAIPTRSRSVKECFGFPLPLPFPLCPFCFSEFTFSIWFPPSLSVSPSRQTLERTGIQVRPHRGGCDEPVDLCKRVLPHIHLVTANKISLHLVPANVLITLKGGCGWLKVAFRIRLALVVHSLRWARYELVPANILLEPFVEIFRNGKRVVVEDSAQYLHICSCQIFFGRSCSFTACNHGLQNQNNPVSDLAEEQAACVLTRLRAVDQNVGKLSAEFCNAGAQALGIPRSLQLPGTRAAREHKEVSFRRAVNEFSNRPGFEQGIRKSPEVLHTQIFMKRGRMEVSLDDTHRRACMVGQKLSRTNANTAGSISLTDSAEGHYTRHIISGQQEHALNQLGLSRLTTDRFNGHGRALYVLT